MPQYDDLDRPTKKTDKEGTTQKQDWEVTRQGRTYSQGNKTIIEGSTKTKKGLGFGEFLNAMASIKGGFDED